MVQVDEERVPGRILGQRGRKVHRDRRGSDPALGPHEYKDVARGRGVLPLAHQPIDGGREILLLQRRGDALVHAGPQRLEHQRGVESGGHDEDADLGVLPSKTRQCVW